MIIKVQLSINRDGESQTMLAYNEEQTWFYQGPVPRWMRIVLGAKVKAYFEAELVDDEHGKLIKFGALAPEQDW